MLTVETCIVYLHFSVPAEQLLNNLTASFDQKMRLLLDPNYQSPSPRPGSPPENCSRRQLEEARQLLQQARATGRRVELRRSGRVDKRWQAGKARQEQDLPSVLKEASNTDRAGLRRSSSLTKQERTEVNMKAKCSEKENSQGVTALRDQFEQRALRETLGRPLTIKSDITKLKKKFSERSKRGLKRRHTVGGTKDFSATVVQLLVRGAEAWDRLAPLVSDQKLHIGGSGEELGERRFSLPVEEHAVAWRYSLPGLV